MKNRVNWRRRFFMLLLALAVLVFLVVAVADRLVVAAAKGRLYTKVQQLPYNRTGILLGTTRALAGGGINPFYRHRIEAAVELLRQNKIKYLVISGDNRTPNYNEPEDM